MSAESNVQDMAYELILPDGAVVEEFRTPDDRHLTIRRHTPAEWFDTARLEPGLGIFFRYQADRQMETLRKIAAMPLGNVVVAHTDPEEAAPNGSIAGYVSLHPLDPGEPWAVLNEGGALHVYEFGAIEVSRRWRGAHLGQRLMQAAFHNEPWLEERIVISYEFAWHWDYEELGITRFAYRKMLEKVIASAGFQRMATDEPNILMDPANMFMVRIGANVDVKTQQRFFALLYRTNVWGF